MHARPSWKIETEPLFVSFLPTELPDEMQHHMAPEHVTDTFGRGLGCDDLIDVLALAKDVHSVQTQHDVVFEGFWVQDSKSVGGETVHTVGVTGDGRMTGLAWVGVLSLDSPLHCPQCHVGHPVLFPVARHGETQAVQARMRGGEQAERLGPEVFLCFHLYGDDMNVMLNHKVNLLC